MMEHQHTLTILPGGNKVRVNAGANLLAVLQDKGFISDAPCGGNGICGKCRILLDGKEALACQTVIEQDRIVEIPQKGSINILTDGIESTTAVDPDITGNLLAVDLGTTTMVCYLLDPAGREMAVASALNPQAVYGADVVSRIQAAVGGKQKNLCHCVRAGLSELIQKVCAEALVLPESIQRIALVGNPCMQQLLMDISMENLIRIPFTTVLTERKTIPAKNILPVCINAEFVVIPDISGYAGADTVGCVLSTEMYKKENMTLIVDIGTNGEMVMGNEHHMVACAAAAGPALEGANIRFGMRGSEGAIDHVKWEQGKLKVHVLGDGKAKGICGSGLIDAVAVMLKHGMINQRGRILSAETEFEGERACYLTEDICLTQNDIRQVQLAKGAIAAGIELMTRHLGIAVTDIDEVFLAGAFGSYIDPRNACLIGLLPGELLQKIKTAGNAAGSGARLLACSRTQQTLAEKLCKDIEYLDLASLPEFQRTFGKQINFRRQEAV